MDGTPPRRELPNFLELHAGNFPHKTALIGIDRSLTYSELRKRARALASSLYEIGLRSGDHIAVMSYNLPETLEINTSARYLNVGVVMIGYKMKPPEIEYIVNNSDAKAFLFYHEFEDRILPYKHKYQELLPHGFICFGGKTTNSALSYESLMKNPPDLDLDSVSNSEKIGSMMVYTSGTTGKPKGAARTRDLTQRPGAMEFLFETLRFTKIDSNEIHLVCCPLYHSAPSFFASITFLVSGTLIYQPRFDAEQFLELVAKYKVTSTHLVPTMVVRLLQVPESFTKKLDLSSLHTVICGAAPLFPEYKLAFLDRFGPILYEYYGSTETGLNTFITPEEMREKPDSVGKAFADNDLTIVDENNYPVSDGERGILYMHTTSLMDGYYKNEEATKASQMGKYITVGDVAIKDKDGYYYIVDRIKDMIIRGGVNIYPAEVESVLVTMPGIADAAAVGKPDRELGETVAAFVIKEKDADISEADIKAFCDERMASYKIPSTIFFIDEIPRTPTGKMIKRELRERLKQEN